MKKLTRNILLLISPFLLMILINESMRPTIKGKSYNLRGVPAMNSEVVSKDECSWYCYQSTTYCKNYHVKSLSNYFKYIDPMYDGIIKSLHSTKNYSLANVIFLVILLPLLMFFLLVKVLDMQSQIKLLKSNK